MSRSYKKFGSCPNTSKDSHWKRIFNRRIRRAPIDFAEGVSALADGGAFKRANETWEICDGKSMAPKFEETWWCESPFEYKKLYFCK